MKILVTKETQRARNREWYKNNRDYWRQHVKEYNQRIKKENPELHKARLKAKRKYSRKRSKENRNYQQRWKTKRLLEIFASRENKCELCEFDNVLALQLHHKNGRPNGETKTKILTKSYPPELIQVLCANCHQIAHRGEY